jgi:hypothetical protein
MRTLRFTMVFVLLLGSAAAALCAPRAEVSAPPDGPTVLLTRGFAHNDEQHARPLLDALAYGFCSIEADVYLVDGALLVAHDRWAVDAKRSLEALYLKPLWERFQANGGSIYPEPAGVMLLIDVKNDGAESYRALDALLAAYDPMLTHFTKDGTTPGALTVIISGERAQDVILASSPRRAGIDGRLADLDGPLNANEMPLVSDNWSLVFGWRGGGSMPADQAARLAEYIAKAHAKGMRIRFWSTPQTEDVWGYLYDAGVDLLHADDLAGLAAMLAKKAGQ